MNMVGKKGRRGKDKGGKDEQLNLWQLCGVDSLVSVSLRLDSRNEEFQS